MWKKRGNPLKVKKKQRDIRSRIDARERFSTNSRPRRERGNSPGGLKWLFRWGFAAKCGNLGRSGSGGESAYLKCAR
jgi:hypothetical protein